MSDGQSVTSGITEPHLACRIWLRLPQLLNSRAQAQTMGIEPATHWRSPEDTRVYSIISLIFFVSIAYTYPLLNHPHHSKVAPR